MRSHKPFTLQAPVLVGASTPLGTLPQLAGFDIYRCYMTQGMESLSVGRAREQFISLSIDS